MNERDKIIAIARQRNPAIGDSAIIVPMEFGYRVDISVFVHKAEVAAYKSEDINPVPCSEGKPFADEFTVNLRTEVQENEDDEIFPYDR